MARLWRCLGGGRLPHTAPRPAQATANDNAQQLNPIQECLSCNNPGTHCTCVKTDASFSLTVEVFLLTGFVNFTCSGGAVSKKRPNLISEQGEPQVKKKTEPILHHKQKDLTES